MKNQRQAEAQALCQQPSHVQIIQEQETAARLQAQGLKRAQIAERMGISEHAVKRRLAGFRKAERLDPELRQRLAKKGVVDLAGLHSGWLLEKDKNGSGSSLYFFFGPDQERINFAEAMADVLSSLPRLEPIPHTRKDHDKDLAAFIRIADLHIGSQYGSDRIARDFTAAVDDIFPRLPRAKKAFIMEMGDLLDANDHKGITPASGNNCDVIRENSLTNSQTAVKMLDYAIQRSLEIHDETEVHLIPGNHDPTAYIAVMMALGERYADNKRVNVVVSDAEFRVVQWGKCADFPHHGDKAKWPELKDVFADQFPKAWTAASAHRQISTAHFHHDRSRDLIGAVGRHYRTLMEPNKWARQLGLFSRGSLTAETWHKELGFRGTTQCDIIRPTLEELAGAG